MRFHSDEGHLALEPGGLIGLELGALDLQYLASPAAPAAGADRRGSGLFRRELPRRRVPPHCLRKSGCLPPTAFRPEDRRIGREVSPRSEAVETTSARRKRPRRPRRRARSRPSSRSRSPCASRRSARPRCSPELPGGALPLLALLDEPSHDVEPPSPETRVHLLLPHIERKLADFGVEVKVLAAYLARSSPA